MRSRRVIGAIAASVAIAFALAGCALLPAALSATVPKAGAQGAQGTPVIGQCWSASDADAQEWSNWLGAPAAACSTSHDLYTYKVGSIVGGTPKDWPGHSDAAGNLTSAKAAATCDTSTLLPDLKWNQQLISGFFFVPSLAEWKSGARWVRCDIGVIAFGSPVSSEELDALPASISTLVAAVTHDPKRYEFCVDSPVPVSEAGPLDSAAGQIADCRDDPQWALAGHGSMPEPIGATYPTTAVSNAETAVICSRYATDDSELWIAYLPSRADWAAGDRETECWVGQRSDDGSGGVA
jgi:hypothetical protein